MTTSRPLMFFAANSIVFMVGFLGLAGVMMEIPGLYNWGFSGIAMNYQVGLALMILSTVSCVMSVETMRRKPVARVLSMIGLSLILFYAVSEVSAYLTADQEVSLESFLVPSSPVSGHISFYAAWGLIVAVIGSWLVFILSAPSMWAKVVSQSCSILLVNLAAFGLIENLGNEALFRFLMSAPSALGLLLYGGCLFFSPVKSVQNEEAVSFFFHRASKIHMVLLLLWLVMVSWQANFANQYLGIYRLNVDDLHTLVVVDEWTEIILTSFTLAMGLRLIAVYDRNAQLATQLQEAFALAATLGHDLKAPIQTQITVLEMLQSGQFGQAITSEKNQNMVAMMIENNRYELELVLNLIDLLRYEAQQEQYNPQPMNLALLLQEVKQELEPLALRRSQTITIPETLSPNQEIMADYLGLKRVLHNLISNAIQYIGLEKHIEVDVVDTDQAWLFSVKDDGPGLPQGVQANLFQRASKGNVSTTASSSGGLGLYITRKIINRHGGEIWVESLPGKGSTFYYTVPKIPLV